MEFSISSSISHVLSEGIIFLLAPYGYGINSDEYSSSEQVILLTLLLPDPHRHLVEMTVVDALRVLSGESFTLNINPVSRTVEFELKESYQRYVTQLDIEQANFEWSLHYPHREGLEIKPLENNQSSPLETYGPILSGETLGSITETIGLNGLSLEQRMIQIFEQNPHAFNGNNMNALLVGAQLDISFQTTAPMTPRKAAKFVWDEYSLWLEAGVGQ